MSILGVFAILAGVQVCICVEMKAELDVAGFKGTVSFERNIVVDADVDVTLNFSVVPSNTDSNDYDTIEVWSLPAVFGRHKNATHVCNGGLGNKVLNRSISDGTITISNLLEPAYFHRSVVVYSSTNATLPKLCGTILPISESVTTYRAKFIGPVFGTIWLRSLANVGTYFYGDLVMISESATAQRDLAMFSTGSINDTRAFANRCNALSGSTTVATVTVQNSTLSEGTFGGLTSVTSFMKNFAVMNGETIEACATLRRVSPKTVTSLINWEGIKGSFEFTQNSPFDSTSTTVELTGLQTRTKGYHVHKFPVPQRLSATESPCAGKFVSGHFNPYNVDVNKSPPAGTGTSDEYEIGDLSGKYGTLAGMVDHPSETYIDWNLPLFGVNSIVGRSVVIHNDDSSNSRLMCSTIGYPAVVKTGIAVFKAPTYGTMYFRQDVANPDEDTTIFVELASQSKTKSDAHNWHVHVYPVNDDAFASSSPCVSAGGHYNPSGISVESPYSTECRPEDPLRCELGDLSGRLGGVNIMETMRTEQGKYFFTDEYLPLSGAHSVLGRSVVVHTANAGAPRYACANITRLHPVVVKTSGSWVGTSDGSASGDITMEQATEFDATKVTGSFSNLANLASGYHIHEYTISTSAKSGSECGAESVSGHYNPFNIQKPFPSATVETYDRYEVGDLSNKYGLLDDEVSATVPGNTMDTNLPLHTRLSSADRSIVIHKKQDAARWKCANLNMQPADGSNGHVIKATVTFSSKVSGTIKLKQLVYEDGGAGLTTYEVDVGPKSGGSNTLQHNWHIHVEPVTSETGCDKALGHYDPYSAIDNKDYSADCAPENPLFCEVGDLSKKQAKYDIGGGRKMFHDVDTPLHTNFTVLGRSIVFHNPNGGAPRYACANIVPDSHTYTLSFSSSTEFNRYVFTKTIADALGINRLRVVIIHNYDVPVKKNNGCSKVMVHIAGGASVPGDKLSQLSSGTLSGLGAYAPTSTCKNEEGASVLGQRSGARTHKYSHLAVMFGALVTLFFTKHL